METYLKLQVSQAYMEEAKVFITKMLKGGCCDYSRELNAPTTPATKLFQFCDELSQKALHMPYHEVSLLVFLKNIYLLFL